MSVSLPDPGAAKPASFTGKVGLSLFFSVFLGMGLIFLFLVGMGIWQTCQTLTWPAVPCVITESQVINDPSHDAKQPYLFQVKYSYSFNGQSLVSGRYSEKTESSSTWSSMEELFNRYPVGKKTICYVNPSNPSEAILQHQSLWLAAFAFIPLVFVLVGGGGIWFVWHPPAVQSKPLSEQASRPISSWVGGVFFFVFFAVGLVAAFVMSGSFLDAVQAGSWIQTPCVVESSRVLTHDDDDGDTYSVDVLYRYSFQGKTYHSSRYAFMGGSSSGYSSRKSIVEKFPPGSSTCCYVDPNDPSKAVLYRGWSGEMFLIVVPILFMLVGAGGMYHSFKAKSPGKSIPWKISQGTDPGKSRMELPSSGPLVLKPKVSPFAKLAGTTVVAVFWNGIISIFLYQVWESWQSGHFDWFFGLFMIPFVVVGLVAIGAIFYFALALGNPTVKIALNPAAVALGESIRLGWGFDGKTTRIQHLSIVLQGREEATYRRGTSTYTDRNVFFRQDLIDVSDSQQIRQGLAEAEIPGDLMHTFSSGNNKIVWTLTLHGSIPRWPDVKEEFEFEVLPARRIS